MLEVELVYSSTDKKLAQQFLILEEGSCVNDAIEQSGILKQYPETEHLDCGIFSKLVTKEQLLKNGDRLEIYRALSINPMDKRRLRAKARKKQLIASKNNKRTPKV